MAIAFIAGFLVDLTDVTIVNVAVLGLVAILFALTVRDKDAAALVAKRRIAE